VRHFGTQWKVSFCAFILLNLLFFPSFAVGQTTVALTWDASTSQVAGYDVFRGTVSGGPYTQLNASLVSRTSYTDSTVQNGQTYYYVTTAVSSSGMQSRFSNQSVAVIPNPTPPPVTTAIAPTSVTLASAAQEQFTASVTGTTNTAVSWTATSGTINATGLFTAPTVAAATNVVVTAQSQADPTKTASAKVTVNPPPPSITIAIAPTSATLASAAQEQFTASVTGTTNTAVTWTATSGTINATGLFTAPTVAAATNVVVTAQSQADPTKTASAKVTVNPPTTGPKPGRELALYNLGGGSAPNVPYAGLIADEAGNLYGTTELGGTSKQGTVFELSPTPGGIWTQTVLYSFAGGADGAQPHGGLLLDSSGNLYGTTNFGGNAKCLNGCGTVFKLTQGSSTWTESVLYTFSGGSDGQQPNARLLLDGQGNLYGTTMQGGNISAVCPSGCGTVFRLAPTSGSWNKTVLHAFNGNDGASPYAEVTSDLSGNLYGTTYAGGSYAAVGASKLGPGTVFKLTPGSNGSWTETVLHSFKGKWDGGGPIGGVILDSAGNIYGTTFQGGAPGHFGVVFKLQPQSTGEWQETVLHVFMDSPAAHPMAGLVFDGSGNLYGTTALGGYTSCPNGCGTLFTITPSSSGHPEFRVLRLFGRGSDGSNPSGDLILDSNGNLWGTTQSGGSNGAGTVFEVAP